LGLKLPKEQIPFRNSVTWNAISQSGAINNSDLVNNGCFGH
jgi:hypothetical protein